MADDNVVLHERLKQLNEYISDLRELQQIDFKSEEEIVPDDLLSTLTAMARFRNLIVHDYMRIDNTAVFRILKKRLDDFEAFTQAMVAYLQSR